MPSTDSYKIPLYTDGESPDLSTTGHYNRAMVIIDNAMKAQDETMDELNVKIDGEISRAKGAEKALGESIKQEATARTNADNVVSDRITTIEELGQQLAVSISQEATARTNADNALSDRVTTIEELGQQLAISISTNSDDITGIKGLTYGDEHVKFLEKKNGSYNSPALELIADQIAIASTGITANTQWGQIEA